MEKDPIKQQEQEAKVAKQQEYAGKIQGWKKKHGKVKVLWIGEGKDIQSLFFRLPSRQEMAATEKLAVDEEGNLDAYKKSDRSLFECLLGGDYTAEEILADAELYMSVARFTIHGLVAEKKTSWESC